MTSDNQREAMALLAEVWALSTDVRLGQLLSHLGFLGEVHLGKGLGYIDDDELLSILYRHRADLQARLQPTTVSGVPTENGMPNAKTSATP